MPAACALLRLFNVVSPFDAHRNAHAAADAKRGETFLRVALLHLVEQRDQHAPARGADRVTERDRSAVDVDLRGIPAEILVDGTRSEEHTSELQSLRHLV